MAGECTMSALRKAVHRLHRNAPQPRIQVTRRRYWSEEIRCIPGTTQRILHYSGAFPAMGAGKLCCATRRMCPSTEVPPEGLLPYRPARVRPYLYSEEEIRRLLQAALELASLQGLASKTYYCLLGLLSVTGLRISEALHLRSEDVDLTEGILAVRSTKFGKSRFVPIHT